MTVRMIWAEARNRVIGSQVELGMPWHLPEDLINFRFLTEGQTVVMGRRTWESLPARWRPLPTRKNLVLTTERGWTGNGAITYNSIDRLLADYQEFWVIGGGQVYEALLPFSTVVQRTKVDLEVSGDVLAPKLDRSWVPTSAQQRRPPQWRTSTTGLRFKFETLVRR